MPGLLHRIEIAPPIVVTTTPQPRVVATVRPTSHRKQHQNHKGKNAASGGSGSGGNGSGSNMSSTGSGNGGRGRGQYADLGGAGNGSSGITNHIRENELIGEGMNLIDNARKISHCKNNTRNIKMSIHPDNLATRLPVSNINTK